MFYRNKLFSIQKMLYHNMANKCFTKTTIFLLRHKIQVTLSGRTTTISY